MRRISSIQLAEFIIAFFLNKGDLITNKKLQKLLYYIDAWHLVYFEVPLLDEQPQAWVHGPVYPNVYHRFKEFGVRPLMLEDLNSKKEDVDFDAYIEKLIQTLNITEEQYKLIKTVLLKYGSMSAYQLEVLTHRENPWTEQRVGLSEFDVTSNLISYESMREYYQAKLS